MATSRIYLQEVPENAFYGALPSPDTSLICVFDLEPGMSRTLILTQDEVISAILSKSESYVRRKEGRCWEIQCYEPTWFVVVHLRNIATFSGRTLVVNEIASGSLGYDNRAKQLLKKAVHLDFPIEEV